MAVSRRGFLGMLIGASILAAETGFGAPKKAVKGSASAKAKAQPVKKRQPETAKKKIISAPQKEVLPLSKTFSQADAQMLMDAYFPILKVNEAEKLHFYHRKGDKVTVGYGTNVESNSGYLAGVVIYHQNKALTPEERTDFFNKMKTMSNADLAGYTISKDDAKKMAVQGMTDAIQALTQKFATVSNPKFFHRMPLCMQALCLDVFYNVGRKGFAGYPKFQAAIRSKNYDEALKQSVVYVDKKKKITNEKREWMKKRLLAVMRLVQGHPTMSWAEMAILVKRDYEKNTPALMRLLSRSNLEGELSMAKGELSLLAIKRREMEQKRAINLAQSR
ncbi:MAG: hypothetical protein SPL08_05330 [Pseudomonadota bacterium]|nr:hypothetical protein [Pseudomonadota bacterium]